MRIFDEIIIKTHYKARGKLFQNDKSILLYNFFAQMTIFEASFFGLSIAPTWYGLMYAMGFFLCYTYIKRYWSIEEKHRDIFLFSVFLGVILGGRLGYVCFYNFEYFVDHPTDILAIWQGGMSFHGGALWVILAMVLFARRYHYRLFDISDVLVTILPLALWLGRIGNAINQELLGYSPYSGPFAVIKNGVSYFPSPLLQAFLEGIVLLSIMLLYRHYEQKSGRTPWRASAIFLIGYGILRIFAELFRTPDAHIGYLAGTEWMTLGMIYSIPMILAGVILLPRGWTWEKTT